MYVMIYTLWLVNPWEKCGFPKVAHKHFIIFGKCFPFSRHRFNFSDQNINITITSSFTFASPNWTGPKVNHGSMESSLQQLSCILRCSVDWSVCENCSVDWSVCENCSVDWSVCENWQIGTVSRLLTISIEQIFPDKNHNNNLF